jgi:cobalt-zinc-cadmium efflux system outer membrane protein
LNNREFLATLEDLGIAQADLVEAGLLENPVLSGDLVFSTQGNGLGGGLSLSQSLLGVVLIPAKRRIAKAELQRTILAVDRAALELARDVKVAYAKVQASARLYEAHRSLVQSAEVAAELAARQYDAGNLPELDRQRFLAALDDARLELAGARLAIATEREQLNRLLGLWGKNVSWTLAGETTPPPSLPDLAALERYGLKQRLDVSAARFRVAAVEYALKLRRRGVLPQLEAGVEARNEVGDDPGHEWVVGPSLAIELPLFDPGHADFARIRARLRQAQYGLQHLAIVARSQIRTHREQLLTAHRKHAYLRDTVLHRRAAIQEAALEQYNAMTIGTYELLETYTQRVEAQKAYVEAVRDYWVAHAELELAVGGRLPSVRSRGD